MGLEMKTQNEYTKSLAQNTKTVEHLYMAKGAISNKEFNILGNTIEVKFKTHLINMKTIYTFYTLYIKIIL